MLSSLGLPNDPDTFASPLFNHTNSRIWRRWDRTSQLTALAQLFLDKYVDVFLGVASSCVIAPCGLA